MPLSSLLRDDRVLLLGLTAASAGVYLAVRVLLLRFLEASEIRPIEPKAQYITQETEDSLPMSTLSSLLDHYNFSIRETAVKIVCDRAMNDRETLPTLLRGIADPDYEERAKNLRALAKLADPSTLHLLHTPEAYAAFMTALTYGLGDSEYDMLEELYFDEYYLRDICDRICFVFLIQLVSEFGVEELVQAGFVEKWLAKQRWGGEEEKGGDGDGNDGNSNGNSNGNSDGNANDGNANGNSNGNSNDGNADGNSDGNSNAGNSDNPDNPDDSGTTRTRNFSRYMACRNNRIAEICTQLAESRVGQQALRRAGLLPQPRQSLYDLPRGKRPGIHGSSHENGSRPASRSRPRSRAPSWTRGASRSRPSSHARSQSRSLLHDSSSSASSSPPVFARWPDAAEEDEDSRAGSTGTLVADAAPPSRPSSSTREEQRIRRQHREAMVFNDGTRPLGRHDIIQRESDA